MDKNTPYNSSSSIDESIFDPDKLTQAYEKADTLFGAKHNGTEPVKPVKTSDGTESDNPPDSGKQPARSGAQNNNRSVDGENINWMKIARILAAIISCLIVIYYLDEIYLLLH